MRVSALLKFPVLYWNFKCYYINKYLKKNQYCWGEKNSTLSHDEQSFSPCDLNYCPLMR